MINPNSLYQIVDFWVVLKDNGSLYNPVCKHFVGDVLLSKPDCSCRIWFSKDPQPPYSMKEA